MDLRNPRIALRKAWIHALRGQSMDCLLNPWIAQCERRKAWICAIHGLRCAKHGSTVCLGNPWIVCSIHGLRSVKGAKHGYVLFTTNHGLRCTMHGSAFRTTIHRLSAQYTDSHFAWRSIDYLRKPWHGVVHKPKATRLDPELEVRVFHTLWSTQVGSNLSTFTPRYYFASILPFLHEILQNEFVERRSVDHDLLTFRRTCHVAEIPHEYNWQLAQSRDRANPCFAPNIYIIHWLYVCECYL